MLVALTAPSRYRESMTAPPSAPKAQWAVSLIGSGVALARLGCLALLAPSLSACTSTESPTAGTGGAGGIGGAAPGGGAGTASSGGAAPTGGTAPTGGAGTGSAGTASGGAAPTGGAGGVPASAPGVGAHALAYYRMTSHIATLATPPLTTRSSGSVLIASVGRGQIGAHAQPSDNLGNPPFTQLGTSHTYAQWPSSGTAAYALTSAVGGPNHVLSVSTPADDEITFAVVEVTNGTTVSDYQWNEVPAGAPLTSRAVTTTGPATLVAFWWGDAGVESEKTATPNNGFMVVDAILEAGALVQCAVATRAVAEAGSYDVTWAATPTQGAQLWLIAVQ